MNILTLCNKSPFAASDGGTREISSRLMSWAQMGCTVHALVADSDKHPCIDTAIKGIYLHSARVDLNVRPLPFFRDLFRPNGPVAQRFYSLAFEQALTNLIRHTHFDWIILEHACMGVYIDHIHRLCNTPCILRAPNVEHILWKRIAYAEQGPLRKLALYATALSMKRFETHILKQVAGVISLSEEDRLCFQRMAPQLKTHCIGMGIPAQTKAPLPSKPIIAFVGPAYWAPNLQGVKWFISHVWPLVRQAIPESHCLLIGKGWPELIRSNNGIEAIGYVEKLSEYIRQCRICIAPLLSGSGIKIKVLEAWAHGLCVVSTSKGVEGLTHGGPCPALVGDDPHTFANHCISLLNNNTLCLRLQDEGLAWMDQHANPKTIDKLWQSFFDSRSL